MQIFCKIDVIFRVKIGKISVNSCSVLYTLMHVMYSLGITEKCTIGVDFWPLYECSKLYDLQSFRGLRPLDPLEAHSAPMKFSKPGNQLNFGLDPPLNSGSLYIGVKSSSIKGDIEITDVDNTDIATIKIKFFYNISLILILVYSPQENDSSDDKDKFYTDLETKLERANLSGDYYLVIWDFNAKLATQYIPNDIHEQSSNGLLLSKSLRGDNLLC